MTRYSFVISTTIILLSSFARAQLASFGNDIGNGGTYFINPLSTAPFSFKGGFTGATVVETVTTSMTLPNGNSVSCSPVSSDQANYESVCQITHDQMGPGVYTIFLTAAQEGVEFGRAFTVVNTQVTETAVSTPTLSLTSTPISISTTSITTTVVDTTTAQVVTVTSPAATSGTLTLQPKTTTTSTKIRTKTVKTHIATTITSTKSVTPPCTKTPKPSADSLKAAPKSQPASSKAATPTTSAAASSSPAPSTKPATSASPQHHRRSASLTSKLLRRALIKRDGPDGPLTTIITQTAAPVVQTIVAAPSVIVETDTVEVVQTATVTPTPVTVFAGTVAATVTAPTMTVTSTVRSTSTVTSTVTGTVRAEVKVTAAPTAC